MGAGNINDSGAKLPKNVQNNRDNAPLIICYIDVWTFSFQNLFLINL